MRALFSAQTSRGTVLCRLRCTLYLLKGFRVQQDFDIHMFPVEGGIVRLPTGRQWCGGSAG